MLRDALLVNISTRDSFFSNWYLRAPLLARYTLVVLLVIPIILLASIYDERTLNGINVWIKPLKFNIATAMFLGTLTWYCGWIDQAVKRRVTYRIYTHVLCATLLFMLPWLYFAALIGEPAHYNRTHPILAPMYSVMGVVSVVFTTGAVVVGVLIARNKQSPLTPYFRHAVAWSLCISFIFTVVMAGELASLDSHWIGGTQSDKNGLWPFGWSRDGGDLRVAHFFALHAMHFIPFIALISLPDSLAKWPRTSAALLSIGYCLWLFYVYFQAKSGQAFLAWLV